MPTDDDFVQLARLLGRPLGPVDRRALELWQDREMTFPGRTRRMVPDTMDLTGGDQSPWERIRRRAFFAVMGPHRA